MSAEEPGKNEERLEDVSSAELPQSESADVAESTQAAEEPGKNEERLEGASSAELPQSESTDVAEATQAAEEPGKNEERLEDVSSAELPQSESTDVAEATQAAEEPGKNEEQLEGASSAELPQSESTDVAESTQATEEETAAVEATDAAADAALGESEPDPTAESTDSDTGEAVASESSHDSNDKENRASSGKEEPKYKRGQIYHGVIVKTTPTAVYVDLGDGDEGVVPGRELELMTRKMLESLTAGAEVDVYVVNPRNHRGEIVLSINHALEELDWREAEEFAKSKSLYDALIGGYNKGGLIVRFGRLRGFVPQSQLADERIQKMTGDTPEERYSPMINQPIGVKVMEVNRSRNRLILSERVAMREVRQRRKEALIEELTLGEIRAGTVVSLENFGVFVDIGGAEGLVHLTELDWGHITHPRQAVAVGDKVEVEVISINPEAKRIGLSRRRILRDPWDEIATSMRRGQLVRGRVTKLTKFGAFARLVDNQAVEGLIHISELSRERVSHPREVVKRGDELVLRIVKIDIKERRLGLSLKSVNSTEYLDLDWEMAIQESAALPQEPAAEAVQEDAPAEAEAELPNQD